VFDGVEPQTTEAINHARNANVPILVAINKIDKENTDIERIKNDLSSHEIISEEWGGEHLFVNVSAKTGEGIDALLDAILLQAEVMDLKATYDGSAKGIVIESSLEKGRGTVARLDSITIPLADPSYVALRSITSACNKIASRRASIPSPVLADTFTNKCSPPHSSEMIS
jgi:translation elongation factor EF-4